MRTFLILAVVLAAAAGGAEKKAGSSLQRSLEGLLASRQCSQKNIGVAVGDPQRDTLAAAVGADSQFNPASVSKLLTAAIAFEKLGRDFSFSTRVFADTILVRDSTITVRDLYVQGGGDPTFTAERLWLFVENLFHRGVRKIAGNLVLDDSFFDSISTGPGFDEDSSCPRAYQAPVNALAMNFGTIAVAVRPGPKVKLPVVAALFPEMADTKMEIIATTAPAGKKEDLKIESVPDSGRTLLRLQGIMGADEPCSYSYRRLWQTWEAFGNALRPLLARRGIVFSGKCVHGRVPRRIAERAPLLDFASEPLAVPVNYMFKFSSNFAAEMLFKTLSARRDTTPGSWEKSAAAVAAWWKERGLPGTPIIKNGSGMGNTNRLSAAQIATLLAYVWKQKIYCPEYLAALSTAGVDGTLRSRFVKSRLRGLVRAKTGTLNAYGVSTLAGYILPAGREPVPFAILCSKTGRPQFEDWTLQEEIVEKIADFVLK